MPHAGVMNLTKDEVLVMLKKAYVRGLYEHMEQRYRHPGDKVKDYPVINIHNHAIEDLIQG